MIIYILMYLLSTLILSFGLKAKKKYKIIGDILVLIALIIPCLLAAFRDISIGNDTGGYVYNVFNANRNNFSFRDYYTYSKLMYTVDDVGYIFVNYVISILGGKFTTLLFMMELLVVFPIYKAISICKKKDQDIILGMLFFYFFLYNVSLNMLRQSIAIAFCCLSLAILMDQKKPRRLIKTVILFIAGMLFHKTAMFFVLIFLLYWIISNKKISNRNKFLICMIINMITFAIVLNYTYFIRLLVSLNIFPKALIYYNNNSQLNFSFLNTAIYMFFTFIVLLNKKKLKENYDFSKLIAIESVIILQLGCFIKYADRLSLYFLCPLLFNIIPLISIEFKNKINKKEFYQIIIIILTLITYWIITFVLLGLHNTIPYIVCRRS